jgi:hypothetical protein
MENINTRELKSMIIGETKNINNECQATRVPNGWLMRFWDANKQEFSLTSIFVPFNL